MQATLKIKIPADLHIALQENTASKKDLLIEEILGHSDQIAYMLQSYYQREKVSEVNVIPGTIQFIGANSIKLQLEYVMEEFNACSAVDTLNKGKMTVSIDFNLTAEELDLSGEYWPEREPD